VVAICHLPMAIAVYKVYGNQISQNALSFLQYQTGASRMLVTAANAMLILHLIGSYQVRTARHFSFGSFHSIGLTKNII